MNIQQTCLVLKCRHLFQTAFICWHFLHPVRNKVSIDQRRFFGCLWFSCHSGDHCWSALPAMNPHRGHKVQKNLITNKSKLAQRPIPPLLMGNVEMCRRLCSLNFSLLLRAAEQENYLSLCDTLIRLHPTRLCSALCTNGFVLHERRNVKVCEKDQGRWNICRMYETRKCRADCLHWASCSVTYVHTCVQLHS